MEDGQRSCDVLVKKPNKRGGTEAPAKPVKTRDRGTQTNEKDYKPKKPKKKSADAQASEDEGLDVNSSPERSPSPPKTMKRKPAKKTTFEDEDGDDSPKKRARSQMAAPPNPGKKAGAAKAKK